MRRLRQRNGIVVLETMASMIVMIIMFVAIFVLAALYWNQVILGTSTEIAAQSAQTSFERAATFQQRIGGGSSVGLDASNCDYAVNLQRIASNGNGAAANRRAQTTAACVFAGSTNGLLLTGVAPSQSSQTVTATYSANTQGSYGYGNGGQAADNTNPPCHRTTITVSAPFFPVGESIAHTVDSDYRMHSTASIVTGYTSGSSDTTGNNALDRRC